MRLFSIPLLAVLSSSLALASHQNFHTRFHTRGGYGSVVDVVDSAPPVNQVPETLPNRNKIASADFSVSGSYSQPCDGCLSGEFIMFWNGQNVTLTGTGYFQVCWEAAYFISYGEMVPPRWTGLSGKLFHVASGGGDRMDDWMILRLLVANGWAAMELSIHCPRAYNKCGRMTFITLMEQ
ncbi:hypothetical protein N7490_002549 [Penicillium lividum]|nr:hypothetical protein N7490_002549 [Penicillium lividum]